MESLTGSESTVRMRGGDTTAGTRVAAGDQGARDNTSESGKEQVRVQGSGQGHRARERGQRGLTRKELSAPKKGRKRLAHFHDYCR